MKKFQIAIRNELQAGQTLELYFLDEIYDYIDWDTWSIVSLVQDVINKVNAAKPKNIVCYINSEGGSCDIGLAIYSYLKYINAEVETRTLAFAGSIASVIAQAASPGKRYIAKAGFMAIHKAWGIGVGDSKDLRNAANIIDGYTDTIVGVYADQTGKTPEEIHALIADGDYWMTGEECVAQGFADGTFDDVPEGFDILNCIKDLDEHYGNVPEQLAKTKPAKAGHSNQHNSFNMTWKERMAAFTASFKTKPIDPKAANLAEEICNHMAEPMEELLKGMDEDFAERLTKVETDVTDSVSKSFKDQLDALTKTNGELSTKIDEITTKNEQLVGEINDLKGAPTGAGADPKNEGPTPIGFGIKAKATAN